QSMVSLIWYHLFISRGTGGRDTSPNSNLRSLLLNINRNTQSPSSLLTCINKLLLSIVRLGFTLNWIVVFLPFWNCTGGPCQVIWISIFKFQIIIRRVFLLFSNRVGHYWSYNNFSIEASAYPALAVIPFPPIAFRM